MSNAADYITAVLEEKGLLGGGDLAEKMYPRWLALLAARD
jgi:hypothetical protein